MKKVFITYGDQKYKDSLQRIKKEAEALEIFDEIHLYNDKLLPDLFQEYVRIRKGRRVLVMETVCSF